MRRGGTLAAVVLLAACSSFAEESTPGIDASADAPRPRFRFVIEPSLVVLEAGGRVDLRVGLEELPPTTMLPSDLQVTGLPEGVTSTTSLVEQAIHLQAAR